MGEVEWAGAGQGGGRLVESGVGGCGWRVCAGVCGECRGRVDGGSGGLFSWILGAERERTWGFGVENLGEMLLTDLVRVLGMGF